jgi:16S rRNA (uracil1498-N3)-methyltransferase
MAALPFFYCASLDTSGAIFELDEPTARHCVQVLRMQPGDEMHLTDGKGLMATAVIRSAAKKICGVSVLAHELQPAPKHKTGIAISLLKNTSRFEWFLEKATELGITEIIPLACARTEKQQFRFDRMQQIVVSAMLQSRQTHLLKLNAVTSFSDALPIYAGAKKFMAHCYDDEKKMMLANALTTQTTDTLIIIGPEGDFTQSEVNMALAAGFIPVSLGKNRLRTETAGITAAVLLASQVSVTFKN